MERKVDKLFVAVKDIVVYQGKVLLIQESSKYLDGTQVGKWDVPGGRIQPGESWRDALRREIKEETGLEVKIGKPVYVGEWWPKPRDEQWQVVGTFVVCEASSDRVTLSDDHQAFKWVDPIEVGAADAHANSIKEAIAAYISS